MPLKGGSRVPFAPFAASWTAGTVLDAIVLTSGHGGRLVYILETEDILEREHIFFFGHR